MYPHWLCDVYCAPAVSCRVNNLWIDLYIFPVKYCLNRIIFYFIGLICCRTRFSGVGSLSVFLYRKRNGFTRKPFLILLYVIITTCQKRMHFFKQLDKFIYLIIKAECFNIAEYFIKVNIITRIVKVVERIITITI